MLKRKRDKKTARLAETVKNLLNAEKILLAVWRYEKREGLFPLNYVGEGGRKLTADEQLSIDVRVERFKTCQPIFNAMMAVRVQRLELEAKLRLLRR